MDKHLRPAKRKRPHIFSVKWQDSVVLIVTMAAVLDLSLLLRPIGANENHASLFYVLGVLIVSRFTTGYLYGILASFISVIVVNYAFIHPYYQFSTHMTGYPLTFLAMFSVSIVTSTLTSQIKQEEQIRIAAEQERLRANLLRAVGHDLRTPLASIIGSATVALENESTLSAEEKRQLLENVKSEAQWMLRMAENLLSITRVGGHAYRIQKSPEIPEEIIGEVVEKFQSRFPHILIEVEVPDCWLEVPMDAMLIEQVLWNLLENAAVHGSCTELRIQVERVDDWVRFAVSDNGSGISAARMNTLDADYMEMASTSSADKKRNMGIGLLVCRDIIKVHGGVLSARNKADSGAEFEFTLPMEGTVHVSQRKDHGYRG